jgi:serine/threonine-protein kinase
VRPHLPPLKDWKWPRLKLPAVPPPRQLRTWALYLGGAAVAGYLTAYLVLFPAPILPGREEVPRLIGLTADDAQELIDKRGMRRVAGGEEPHYSAPAGTVIWQDPPPGVVAPAGVEITLVTSAGPAKIPVPDVAGYDGERARSFMRAAGLTVSRVESVQAPAPRGVTVVTRPPAASVLAPGAGVVLVVSQGAPTIAVPDLLGFASADARARLELDGLQLGSVTRRRTPDATPGTVIQQRPAAGTLAAPGTVVDVVIARSP